MAIDRSLAYQAPDRIFTLRFLLPKLRGETHSNCLIIHAFDANVSDPRTGHNRIDVMATLGGKVLFPMGQLWCGTNRWTGIDSAQAKHLVMTLLAMKPGDTDAEFFADYTPEQLAFAGNYGEELVLEANRRYGDL